MSETHELTPSDLRRACDPGQFKFKNTSEIKPLDKVIGQQRAVRAIEFGLGMKSPGYHIFVCGVAGTGKSTIVRDIAAKYARKLPAPCDWCLVNNFKDAFRPKALALPSGKAVSFSRKIARLVEDLRKDLPKAFESESYHRRSASIRERHQLRQSEAMKRLEAFAAERGLQVDTAQPEQPIVAVRNGQLVDEATLSILPAEVLTQIEKAVRDTQAETAKVAREIDRLNQALHDDIEKLVDEITLGVLKSRLGPIRREFKNIRAVQEHLDQVTADVVDNVHLFLPPTDAGRTREELEPQPPLSKYSRYQVNVLVGQERNRGAPVIYEPNPTYTNLFGRIEKRPYMGTVTTDFTMVQAGSLLEANGGFLILDVEAVLSYPAVWEALKRSMQTKMLVIEDISEETGFGTVSLRPEAIALDVKVILLGLPEPFEFLQAEDAKFNKIFRVRADFDDEVARTEDTMHLYARFIARVCKEEKLLPFTAKGVAAVVDHGVRTAEDRSKLSIRFGPIQALLKEADYWARRNNARTVTDTYVAKALDEHRFRTNLLEEKIQAGYLDETVLVDVDGAVVGQVNALAVYPVGEYSFGRPYRITAETYLGKQGVINIEREAKLSGSTHDKGVLILSGYLGRIFAQNHPLNLSISITFEQSYGGIDGDSASSTELYAVISSLSGIPLKQGIAVTGSVNQKGQTQAVGDANQKIEGFFAVCKGRGFNGRQGVMIPRANIKNLMLKAEVIEAVRRGEFHIYAVATVEEGIEILTGLPAGQPDPEGNYPENTVYGAAQRKLVRYLERHSRIKKRFGRSNTGEQR